MRRADRDTMVRRLMPIAVFGLLACSADSAGDAGGAGARASRVLEASAPLRDGGPRVLVYHDMEGLAGQDDTRTFSFRNGELYAKGREMLTADVNAVIDGLFAGGASEVHVVDAHGSGNPEPDLLLDRLDRRAKMIFRDQPFRQYVDLVEPGAYDAIAVVGMHAKTGSGGFASHTFTIGMDIIMNGMSITETEIIGFAWGRVGTPVIFASGDDRLAADLAPTMPWTEFVTVKQATSASTAILRPVAEVHAEMRETARRALENRDQAKAMKLTTPVRAALRVVPPASVAMLRAVPGLDYSPDQVAFTAADFQAAYDGVIGLINVATGGYQGVLQETIRSRPDGAEIMRRFSDNLSDRWFDFESGRWTPPSPSEPLAGRRYHGAN